MGAPRPFTALHVPLRAADRVLGLALELVLHVTVLAPFVPEPSPTDLETLRRLAAAVPPFDVRLERLDRFAIEEPNVFWLAPEPAAPFLRLTEAVTAAFPGYLPFAGRYAEVVPHATVATGPAVELDAAERRLRASLPLRDRATELELVRVGETVTATARWPLGG